MIVVIYSPHEGATQRVATAYVGKTLDQVKSEGWGSNPNVVGFYEVDDGSKVDLDGGGWICSLSAEEVVSQGAKL